MSVDKLSKACISEACWCGAPATKKVGEEIMFDDIMPARHNLTAYVCAAHYAQMMGPAGAEQVGFTRQQAEARATVVPDGWKLVPTKATAQMEQAGSGYIFEDGIAYEVRCDAAKHVWSAMLAAVPASPTETPGSEGAGWIERLRESLTECVAVLERLPYGDWPGRMYSGKVAAANRLIRRARLALNEQGEG